MFSKERLESEEADQQDTNSLSADMPKPKEQPEIRRRRRYFRSQRRLARWQSVWQLVLFDLSYLQKTAQYQSHSASFEDSPGVLPQQ